MTKKKDMKLTDAHGKPLLRSTDSAGRLRGGKSGKPRRTREEMIRDMREKLALLEGEDAEQRDREDRERRVLELRGDESFNLGLRAARRLRDYMVEAQEVDDPFVSWVLSDAFQHLGEYLDIHECPLPQEPPTPRGKRPKRPNTLDYLRD
jgi:hypothetical protein